jgi:hypothetical protein
MLLMFYWQLKGCRTGSSSLLLWGMRAGAATTTEGRKIIEQCTTLKAPKLFVEFLQPPLDIFVNNLLKKPCSRNVNIHFL